MDGRELAALPEIGQDGSDVPTPVLSTLPATPIAGEYITQLQHLCDSHGLQPQFAFDNLGGKPEMFVGEMEVDGFKLQWTNPQRSKKEVKRCLCELSLTHEPFLENIRAHGVKRIRSRPPGSQDVGLGSTGQTPENWIGILNEYGSQHSLRVLYDVTPSPTMTPKFTATVCMQSRLLSTPDVESETFSSSSLHGDNFFATKKDARAAAAQHAVTWLRQQGHLPAEPKKRVRVTGPVLGSSDAQNVVPGPAPGSATTNPPSERLHRLIAEMRECTSTTVPCSGCLHCKDRSVEDHVGGSKKVKPEGSEVALRVKEED